MQMEYRSRLAHINIHVCMYYICQCACSHKHTPTHTTAQLTLDAPSKAFSQTPFCFQARNGLLPGERLTACAYDRRIKYAFALQ